MASRGRGRGGRPVNLPIEPGAHKNEMPPPMMQPPPDYPFLEHKPLPTIISGDFRYMLQLKKGFAVYMQESPNFVQPVVPKKDLGYSAKKIEDLTSKKQRYETRFDWDRMPPELKPQKKKQTNKRKATIQVGGLRVKKLKDIDIEGKLKELENKEINQQSDAEEEEDEDEEGGEKDAENIEENEEEVDEEMDEGTDYVNNYFDNGENYEDDEDNLDDGAIF